MKFFFFALIVLNLSYSYAQDTIYFLDVDKLINESNGGKKIISKLEKINIENIKKIEVFSKKLKQEEEEINRIKNIISNEDYIKKKEDLKTQIIAYRDKKNKIFDNYNNLKNQELRIYFKNITPIIEQYMETNSIKLILDKKNIFIADANYDITDKLIIFLNKRLKND
ncbi:OmpH family outer membrane protein [Candidatus Pelagibacter sp. HIMB1485]|uniref:OmpH family outer membrane protein n=1 Tax=Candidatus Pelagibacter sp. HIMB1485 TaxID=3415415 RepID=UPI003F82F074